MGRGFLPSSICEVRHGDFASLSRIVWESMEFATSFISISSSVYFTPNQYKRSRRVPRQSLFPLAIDVPTMSMLHSS